MMLHFPIVSVEGLGERGGFPRLGSRRLLQNTRQRSKEGGEFESCMKEQDVSYAGCSSLSAARLAFLRTEGQGC
jgi:hypothetical protein